jgi:hypothetical protein
MGELRTLASELEVASRAVPESTVDKASSKAEVKEEDSVSDDDTINPVEQVAKTKVPRGGKQSITLEVSQAFLDLLAKLRAFETLLNQGEHMKAAIVAEDVQNTLDNFDPRSYFPQMFSRFSELLSHHAELIGNNIENRDSFSWKTMAQFYKVDVDKFVQGEGNGRGRKR